MSAFDDFIEDVLDGTKQLAVGVLKDLALEIRDDTKDFLKKSRERLEKWTGMLAEGALDEEEFAFLVEAQKDLLKMKLITKAGISAAQIRRLRDDIISLVIRAAIGRFLP